jgi:hypothetical protein
VTDRSGATVKVTWLDRDAGPIVRPYAMTSGRTRPVRGAFDLVSIVRTTGRPAVGGAGLGPEAAEIIRMCRIPLSVVEIAARLDLPVGTVKVLLGDLLDQELIYSRNPVPGAAAPTESILEAVMHALRSL